MQHWSFMTTNCQEAKLNKWAFPAFGVPKKNRQIWIVTYLRKLNCMLEHAEFHILTIDNTLTRIQGFKHAMAINLNMGYMALRLNAHTQLVLQIIFLFGIYEYQVLPMGVKPAMDLFQLQMIQSYAPKKERSPMCYIDNILHCVGNSLQEHLNILSKILGSLAAAGLQVNANKSETILVSQLCQQLPTYAGPSQSNFSNGTTQKHQRTFGLHRMC